MNRMVLMAALAWVVLCFAACTQPGASEKPVGVILPETLKDCKFYKVYDPAIAYYELVVVRCPNSVTSTTSKEGKASPKTVVTIDQI